MDHCRVCLKKGADIFIFDGNEEDSVYNKLSLSVREKVEDLEGYPRNICIVCYSKLELICAFIKKYKESHTVLSTTVVLTKLEPFDDSHIDDNHIDDNHIDDNHIDYNHDIKIDESKIKYELEFIDSKPTLCESRKLKIDKSTDMSITQINDLDGNETSELQLVTQVDRDCKTKKRKRNNKDTKVSLKEFKVRARKSRDKLKRKNDLEQKRKIKSKIRVQKEGPKLCDECGDVFKNSDQLVYHRKTKHSKTSIECPTCKGKYSNNLNLKRHIIRKHTDQRDFACDACSASYAFKWELANHYKSVHEKKPIRKPKTYSCKICGKTFKCNKSVVVHERSVHTGERPAVCTVCKASFTHDEYLKEHMRLHTGEAPFKCPICGRGYAQRGNMKSHLRIHNVSELDPETLSELKPAYLKRLKTK